MKEKCPDIDTSSSNIEDNMEIKNYNDLDINTLEKEFQKTKEQYEKEKEKEKKFKKAKITHDSSYSKIDTEYSKSHVPSIYETEEPFNKTYLGVIIAFIIIIVSIIILIILINYHYSNINSNRNSNQNNENEYEYKIIMKNNTLEFIKEIYNFTKEELSNITIDNLKDEKYIDLCLKGILLNKKKYKLSKYPKISIIKPILKSNDSLKYLNYSLRSIQNQNFTDIEIIIIDDASNNEIINTIKKYQEEDSRIKLLINEEEKGLLYTISKGILNSKGKYIMGLDQDDMFTYGTLFYELFNEAEKNNLDFISFFGFQEKRNFDYINKFTNINQTFGNIIEDQLTRIKLGYRMNVYNFNETGMIWNKFVKKEIYINSINKIGEKYYGKYIITHDNSLLAFMIYREAKRLREFRKFGRFKFIFDESILSERKNNSQRCYEYLIYLDTIFEFSDNDKTDKYFAGNDFISRYHEFKYIIDKSNKELAISVAKKYLKCKSIIRPLNKKIKNIYNEILNKKFKNSN